MYNRHISGIYQPIFKVDLDRQSRIYRPGEFVEGYLTYLLRQTRCKITGISVALICQGEVHWGDPFNECSVGDEVYEITPIYIEKRVRRVGDGISTVFLKPGERRVRFAVKLPLSCPQTIEGLHGSIRYCIGGVLDGDLTDLESEYSELIEIQSGVRLVDYVEGIEVKEILDLNLQFPELHLSEPAISVKANSGFISSLLGNQFLLLVSIITPKKAYTSGEIIHFRVKVDNGSLNTVTTLSLKFIQELKFTANFHSKYDRTVLCEVICPIPIEASCSKSWGGEILVPNEILVSSVGINAKRCVTVGYHLKAVVESSGSQVLSAVKVKLPLIIGTVALDEALNKPLSKTKSVTSFKGSMMSLFSGRHMFPYSDRVISEALSSSRQPPDYFTAVREVELYPAPPSYEDTTTKTTLASTSQNEDLIEESHEVQG